MSNVNAFARMAAAQYGLLTLNQLRTGLTDAQVRALTRRGVLERRRRGLYLFAGSAPSWEGDVMAACLSTPDLAAASHRSALRLWGFRSVDDEVEVSIRYPARLNDPSIIVHRSRDLSEHDITYIDAIPVTSPTRTLCDAGLVFPDHEVERLTHHALAKELLTPTQLWRYRRRVGRHGRTGVGPLERVLERLPPGIENADSGPEIKMRALCDEYGLPEPVWQHTVLARGRRYVIDFCYPSARVAIEYDEFDEHTKAEVFESDRERQNNLIEVGWTVARLVWRDLVDHPAATARRLRSLLHPPADL